jgi:uncharacterized protein involved in outer membrane biogenesis
MKSWRKAAAWSGGAIVLLALAGAVTLHALVDPERLKESAREKAQAAWGRDLQVGDASLALWPLPALHAEDITLSNAEWAEAPHLLRADTLDARLEWLPLLTGKVRLKSLDLEGVRVDLETSAEGTSNVPSPGTRQPKSSPASDLLNLTEVRLKDAEIHQRAKGAEAVWHIDEATLDGSAGLRDVRVEMRLGREGLALAVKAQLADLSRFGYEGATTEGKVDLDWGKTRLAIAGQLPLGPGLRGYSVTADLKSSSLKDMFDFLGYAQRPRAPAEAHLQIRDAQGATEISKLDVMLGDLHLTGDAKLSLGQSKKTFSARLEGDRMDWAQTMLDLGGGVVPPLPPDRVFQDLPLAWPLLVSLQGVQGTADVLVRNLRLRNGVELTNAKSRITFEDDRMNLSPFAAGMLGGSATGHILFEGRRKSVKVDFNGTNLLLQRWFEERGSKIPLTGGPMGITGKFSATGNTMKSLAASVTGPITVRMGPAVWGSQKAGDAEAMMTNAFAPKGASRIDFECATVALPFRNGVATANPIIGFSTTASALITSGKVDLREESLDVSGRVKPKAGSLGLATIAADVKIAGPLRAPKMTLDPAGTPELVARAGAAIATLGLSAVGTAMVDAAQAKKNDPCEVVLTPSPALPQRGGGTRSPRGQRGFTRPSGRLLARRENATPCCRSRSCPPFPRAGARRRSCARARAWRCPLPRSASSRR